MSLPPQVKEKLTKRFDRLIADGEKLLVNPNIVQKFVSSNVITGITRTRPEEHVDFSSLVKWRTDCFVLLSELFPNRQTHDDFLSNFKQIKTRKDNVKWGIATLKSFKENLAEGFLDDLSSQISAEIASDYMSQAERLIIDGQSGKFDHVPAAVLAGAVLENALRTICSQQQQPITLTTNNGKPKTLNPLIDDLKKAAIFNEAKAKQLRAWADIRNHAAHGEFDQFTHQDVEEMIKGVENFLGSYLK